MNLTERLAAAETELAAIKKELEAEQVSSLLPCFKFDDDHLPLKRMPNMAYYNAVRVMIELSQQPGSEAVKDGETQYAVYFDCGKIETSQFKYDSKLNLISPCFRTKQYAKEAIKAVGAERIARMFCTLHGVE
jgi:hypothetical protein